MGGGSGNVHFFTRTRLPVFDGGCLLVSFSFALSLRSNRFNRFRTLANGSFEIMRLRIPISPRTGRLRSLGSLRKADISTWQRSGHLYLALTKKP